MVAGIECCQAQPPAHHPGWGVRPLETFSERFEDLLVDVVDLGFRAIDLQGVVKLAA